MDPDGQLYMYDPDHTPTPLAASSGDVATHEDIPLHTQASQIAGYTIYSSALFVKFSLVHNISSGTLSGAGGGTTYYEMQACDHGIAAALEQLYETVKRASAARYFVLP